MFRIRWIVPCLVVALGAVTRPSTAQVAEIQVLPAELNLTVGEQGIVIATLFDTRGNPITAALQLTWVSTNLTVATVSFDQNTPNFATVTAVSAGIAQIEARSGNVRSTVVIAVSAPQIQQPQAQPGVPPDSVLPNATSNASLALVSRIEPHSFGFAQDCRVGGFVGANLLLTTYLAIRGADSIVVVLPNAQRVTTGVRVAAYDAPSDLAVLHIPVQRTGDLSVGQDPNENDFVWVVGQPNCQTTQTRRTRIARVPSSGPLRLSQTFGRGQLGAPVINRDGAIVGLASGGASAIRATDVSSITNQARRNLASGSLLTAIQVARAERHAYGSVALRSNMTNATARIRPLEDWQWPELAQQNTLPFTFSGPQGRYRIELVASGAVQNSTTVTIAAGVANQLLLTPDVLAQAAPVEEPQPPGAQISPQGGGGGGAVIAVVLLLAGGGAAAAFLLKPKENGPTGPINGGGGSGVGGIRISIPAR